MPCAADADQIQEHFTNHAALHSMEVVDFRNKRIAHDVGKMNKE